MTRTRQTWRLAKLPLAVSLASTLAAPAFGVNFNIGEIEGQFDSSLSVGASWSVRGADPDFIGSFNGGKGETNTNDDGRLNFKKGETFSKIFKGIHDLELKYGDTGVFLRGKYWYDFELKDESRLYKDIRDDGRKSGAQSSGAEVLDAFVYHNYSIGDLPGSVRVGKQVVSWGESTFIGNSINAVNPIDAAAFRRPGAEIKEGLIPVNMFYISQSLTDSLSMEAFYQLEWDQTVVDNCGTFFSTADTVADGCDQNMVGVITRPQAQAALAGAVGGAANANTVLNALQRVGGVTWEEGSQGLVLPRGADEDADDDGQYGLAMRWLTDEVEYGLYYMNYHSRSPYISSHRANPATDINGPALAAALGPFAGVLGSAAVQSILGFANSRYNVVYPEDIRLYGLSFSTTLPTGTAWSGEISYRPNLPVQINGSDVISAVLGASSLPSSAGSDIVGYRRKEVTQVQTTFTHFVDQVMGADRLTLVGEVAMTHVGGLEGRTEGPHYGRDSAYGIYTAADDDGIHGFVTTTSWGYRTRAILDYSDVIAGVNLKPSLAWSHDVDGYGPNGLFNEGAKAVSLGLDAEYQNTYTTSLSYTDFFGGKYNTIEDRDFVALSFGVNF